jgi:hypothetical protein
MISMTACKSRKQYRFLILLLLQGGKVQLLKPR